MSQPLVEHPCPPCTDGERQQCLFSHEGPRILSASHLEERLASNPRKDHLTNPLGCQAAPGGWSSQHPDIQFPVMESLLQDLANIDMRLQQQARVA